MRLYQRPLKRSSLSRGPILIRAIIAESRRDREEIRWRIITEARFWNTRATDI